MKVWTVTRFPDSLRCWVFKLCVLVYQTCAVLCLCVCLCIKVVWYYVYVLLFSETLCWRWERFINKVRRWATPAVWSLDWKKWSKVCSDWRMSWGGTRSVLQIHRVQTLYTLWRHRIYTEYTVNSQTQCYTVMCVY